MHKNINNYTDLPKLTLDKIEHFFKNYKSLENNKWVKTNGFRDNKFATNLYNKCLI